MRLPMCASPWISPAGRGKPSADHCRRSEVMRFSSQDWLAGDMASGAWLISAVTLPRGSSRLGSGHGGSPCACSSRRMASISALAGSGVPAVGTYRLRSISFCRDRTLAQSPACAALKILCRSRRTSSSRDRQPMESQSWTAPSGPFTPRAAAAEAIACPVIVPNVPFGSGGPGRSPSKTHPVHVSTLSGPGTLSRIRPVIRDGRRRTRPPCPSFLPPFGTPAFASWTILFPPGSSASLTAGLPAALTRPDPDGVPTFRWHEARPGRVPSMPRKRRCPRGWASAPSRRLPLRNGSPCTPATQPIGRGSL
jgi:hypothetical protein